MGACAERDTCLSESPKRAAPDILTRASSSSSTSGGRCRACLCSSSWKMALGFSSSDSLSEGGSLIQASRSRLCRQGGHGTATLAAATAAPEQWGPRVQPVAALNTSTRHPHRPDEARNRCPSGKRPEVGSQSRARSQVTLPSGTDPVPWGPKAAQVTLSLGETGRGTASPAQCGLGCHTPPATQPPAVTPLRPSFPGCMPAPKASQTRHAPCPLLPVCSPFGHRDLLLGFRGHWV